MKKVLGKYLIIVLSLFLITENVNAKTCIYYNKSEETLIKATVKKGSEPSLHLLRYNGSTTNTGVLSLKNYSSKSGAASTLKKSIEKHSDSCPKIVIKKTSGAKDTYMHHTDIDKIKKKKKLTDLNSITMSVSTKYTKNYCSTQLDTMITQLTTKNAQVEECMKKNKKDVGKCKTESSKVMDHIKKYNSTIEDCEMLGFLDSKKYKKYETLVNQAKRYNATINKAFQEDPDSKKEEAKDDSNNQSGTQNNTNTNTNTSNTNLKPNNESTGDSTTTTKDSKKASHNVTNTSSKKEKTKKTSPIKVVSCGSVDNIPRSIPRLTRNIYKTIKIFVPIIIIFLGFLDLFKAVTAGDEGSMRDNAKKLIKRIIAGLAVFFVLAAVQMIFGMVEESGNKGAKDVSSCVSCFISSKNSCGSYTTLNFDK